VAWVFDPHSDEEGCFGWVDGRIERLTRIAVVDPRGGERTQESGEPEPVVAAGADSKATVVRREQREVSPVRIRRLDSDEAREGKESSLERLVATVFLYLFALALGFALCWYLFPHVVIMPVVLDPRTGQLIDPQTGQVIAEPKESNDADAASSKPDPSKSGQPSSSDTSKSNPGKSNPGDKKGDDAKPK
jgi:hypothetical protein